MHTPVLLQQAIEALDVQPGRKYIDATVGEGGHTIEILKRGGDVLAIDWDETQIENLKLKTKNYQNLVLTVGNFAQIEEIARQYNFFPVDAVLFDLGLSMAQLRSSKRGFSYQNLEEPLDMRLNRQSTVTAADLINSLPSNKLYEILVSGSEEISSRAISDAIVRARSLKTLRTVSDLRSVLDHVSGRIDEKVYARVFQAFRIAVNAEFENLKRGLQGAARITDKKGKIVVITFHSLEDRFVKNFARLNKFLIVKEKKDKKIARHKFERSAQVRVLEKIL